MIKKNLIFSLLLLFAFISGCYLSISPIKTYVEVDDSQDEINNTAISIPKISGHVVTELWNDTMQEVNCVAISPDGKYMAVATADGLSKNLFFYNTTDYDGSPMWFHSTNINKVTSRYEDLFSTYASGCILLHAYYVCPFLP